VALPDRVRGAGRDPTRTFIQWSFARSAAFRGYWLVTSTYLVVVADLSPIQLVLLGTAMETSVFVAEVPTGVVADTVSRKWSIVISQLMMGGGMLATGLTTSFVPLIITQVVWGVGWTFSSGADIAWVTDEVDDDLRISGIITRQNRWNQYGAIAGIIGLGGIAWATSLATAIIVAGATMIVLAPFVVARFDEHGFTPTREDRWRESWSIFRRGIELARRDHQILLVLSVTVLVASGAEAYDRLVTRHLVDLGLPQEPDPIVWFTLFSVTALLLGALVLWPVERVIDRPGAPRLLYAAAAATAMTGLVILAVAPNEIVGFAGALLVGGIAWTVLRTVDVVWVNQRATSDVRATVQSFLGQCESFGEILGGIALGTVAERAGIPPALLCSTGLVGLALVLVLRSRAARADATTVGS